MAKKFSFDFYFLKCFCVIHRNVFLDQLKNIARISENDG